MTWSMKLQRICLKMLIHWSKSQDIAKEITLESGINVSGLPLHPGAERYYKEKGVLK